MIRIFCSIIFTDFDYLQDGTYVKPKNTKLGYATMVYVRVFIVQVSNFISLYIKTKHSLSLVSCTLGYGVSAAKSGHNSYTIQLCSSSIRVETRVRNFHSFRTKGYRVTVTYLKRSFLLNSGNPNRKFLTTKRNKTSCSLHWLQVSHSILLRKTSGICIMLPQKISAKEICRCCLM